MESSILPLQGGELTIRLDDGMVLKSRVRGIKIDTEVNYDTVTSLYSNDSMNYITDERYTLTAEFEGTYTIYTAPTKTHKVSMKVADSSIKGIVQAQKDAGAPDTASVRVKPTEPSGLTFIVFEWEA